MLSESHLRRHGLLGDDERFRGERHAQQFASRPGTPFDVVGRIYASVMEVGIFLEYGRPSGEQVGPVLDLLELAASKARSTV
ncbi:hypothetical protein OHA25_16080 [Nonomuraea sp. NBC_00507]|uniref:hypothetical protein n=1 Tax=Nonomuraea sp. NBC_00507 TaxID=2976002 RepID=UPI002E186DA8